MESLRDKVALVFDRGLYQEVAVRLAQDFKRVMYYSPWAGLYPEAKMAAIGKGLEGVERVNEFWQAAKVADLIVFPDTFCMDEVVHAREVGYRVFGAGRGETLELDRYHTRELQAAAKLPTQETVKITGLAALTDYLKDRKNLVVKIPKYRGDAESFFHYDAEMSRDMLAHLAHVLGPLADETEFVVEEALEGVEPGLDAITVDGAYLSPTMWGWELKDVAYLGKVCDYGEVPKALTNITDALAPHLDEAEARTFLSIEAIVPSKDAGYLIDVTARGAGPVVAGLQTQLIENYSEVLWAAADGEVIEPAMTHEYGGGVKLGIRWADDEWATVHIPKELRPWVKLKMAAKLDGRYRITPTEGPELDVVAVGDSIEEVIEQVKERVCQIKGHALEHNAEALDEITEKIEEARKVGITF